MDRISPQKRSEAMRRIRSKDTLPEMTVRSMIHRMGYRFRLHAHNLPGKPDVVFPGRKKAIFIHGCFWHHHEDCPKGDFPTSRTEFWIPKLLRNRQRDAEKLAALHRLGWKTLVIWQCQISNVRRLSKKIASFLDK